jgi:hypothetical protein
MLIRCDDVIKTRNLLKIDRTVTSNKEMGRWFRISWPAGRVVNTLDNRRVSARVRSRPGHIQSCEYKKRVCRMRLKTVVPWTRQGGCPCRHLKERNTCSLRLSGKVSTAITIQLILCTHFLFTGRLRLCRLHCRYCFILYPNQGVFFISIPLF